MHCLCISGLRCWLRRKHCEQVRRFAAQHPEMPWALMYTMRNRVAHGYFRVDYELVWNSIHTDLPELREQIVAIEAP